MKQEDLKFRHHTLYCTYVSSKQLRNFNKILEIMLNICLTNDTVSLL